MPVRTHIALAVALAAMASSAAAQTLDRIRESGQIRLGYRTDAEPLSYAGSDGLPAGYSPRVCTEVAALLGTQLGMDEIEADFHVVTAEDRFEKVASGEIDLLCGAATITLERRETVDFSIPTFVDGAAVLLPTDAETEFTALAGKSVGVVADTTTEDVLNASLQTAGIEADVVTFDDHPAGLAALEAGEIAAYFGDQSILYNLFFNSDMADQFVISDNTLTIEKHALALARGDADFRLAVDRALSALYETGKMAEIFGEALPGARPGPALRAMFELAPELP
jgi:polar amino acid transport system substrate-binding protein